MPNSSAVAPYRRIVTPIERRVLLASLLPAGVWPGYVERIGRFFAEAGEAGILDAATFEARLRSLDRAMHLRAWPQTVERLERSVPSRASADLTGQARVG